MTEDKPVSFILNGTTFTVMSRPRILVSDIIDAVIKHHEMDRELFLSKRRYRDIVRPRQQGMWLAKKLTRHSLSQIGQRFGGRDHATVMHGIRTIDDLVSTDADVAWDLSELVRKFPNVDWPDRTALRA